MPFTTLSLLGVGIGAAAAVAGSTELRVSPRPALLSDCFAAYGAFMVLLLLPISAYFYLFHGDWFMLYTVDVRNLPSALVLLGLLAEAGLGVLGFLGAAICVRNARVAWALTLAAACAVAAVSVVFIVPERLRVIGTYRQFWGGFGLDPYGGSLLQGALAMGSFLVYGAAYLLVRIRRGQMRMQRP